MGISRMCTYTNVLGLISAAALSITTASISANANLNDDVLAELGTMKSVYSSEYAPRFWKEKYSGYSLNKEYAKAVAAVNANQNLTTQDARNIFKNFIYSMKDYHTSISFDSTEKAALPFKVKGVGDHFYIVFIDHDKLNPSNFPFNEGDELVTFGGRPTIDVVKEIQSNFIENVPQTDRALAELRLTTRSGTKGLEVPKGPITLGIKPQGSQNTKLVQLIWDYTPEEINLNSNFSALWPTSSFNNKARMAQMNFDASEEFDAESQFDIGARQTFTPALGSKIWETTDDNTFYAYIYLTPDRKVIGYLRLPSYTPDSTSKAVVDFAGIIARFQANTDAMIIDQVNNPGGSVFYLYSLVSMLSDQPMMTPRHRMTITSADVAQALEVIPRLQAVKNDADAAKLSAESADFAEFPLTFESSRFYLNYAQFIVSESKAGHRLTSPFWIGGVDHINPGPVQYTKPILLLINQLDFSGGDFFPTIMQDNKRATIMGTRTAGAGGYVLDYSIPNNAGVASFRVTQSIAERSDSNPIENLGVTPDVPYEMTAEDYTTGFAPYVKAIQTQINSMVDAAKAQADASKAAAAQAVKTPAK